MHISRIKAEVFPLNLMLSHCNAIRNKFLTCSFHFFQDATNTSFCSSTIHLSHTNSCFPSCPVLSKGPSLPINPCKWPPSSSKTSSRSPKPSTSPDSSSITSLPSSSSWTGASPKSSDVATWLPTHLNPENPPTSGGTPW